MIVIGPCYRQSWTQREIIAPEEERQEMNGGGPPSGGGGGCIDADFRDRAQLKKPDQYLLSEHHVSDLRTQHLTCSRSCYYYSLCSWWLNLLVLPETWRFMFCMWHAFWNCPLAPKNVFSKGDYLYTYTFVHSFSPKCTSTKTRCIFYTEIIV